MVVIDTSVWVDFFKNRENPEVARLNELIGDEVDLIVTGVIVQEILSGIKVRRERETVQDQLSGLITVMPTMATHIQAAEVFDRCRKRGYTIRSIIDCLVAALCLEHDLTVLHRDRDYSAIGRVFPLRVEETA